LNSLPFELTQAEFENSLLFCKSDILDIRLVKNYGYVKFKDEGSMKKNLKILKNFSIKGRKIKAQLSDTSKTYHGDSANKYDKFSKPEYTARHNREDDGILGKRVPVNDIGRTDIESHADSKSKHDNGHVQPSKVINKKNDDFRKLLNLK
jgi:RNA recognition motif-containing protein